MYIFITYINDLFKLTESVILVKKTYFIIERNLRKTDFFKKQNIFPHEDKNSFRGVLCIVI